MKKVLDLWFYAFSRRSLRHIRAFIADMTLDMGLKEEESYDIETVVEEALANAMEHAYPEGYGPIKIVIRRVKGGISITVRDWGKPLSPEVLEVAADVEEWFREGKERGMGIAFMKALVDKFEYKNLSDGKEIRLFKKLKAGKP
ncbi:MAG: ATP-binding protein [candidate division WOR-3 bacterium]